MPNPNVASPTQKLAEIYETGISLALLNFEGNDDSLEYEFVSKCKPKYLWLVIRKNLLGLLKPRMKEYKIAPMTEN